MKFLIISIAVLCLAQVYAEADAMKGGPKPQLVIGGQGLYNTGYDNHGVTHHHSGTPIHNVHSVDHGYASRYGHNLYGSQSLGLGQHGYGSNNLYSGLGQYGNSIGLSGYGNQSPLGGFGGLQGYSTRPHVLLGGQFGHRTHQIGGYNQQGLGFNQFGHGLSQHGLGFSQHGLGFNQHGLGLNQHGVGLNQHGLGFGQGLHGFGSNQHGFGSNQHGFGSNLHGLGLNQHGLGFSQHGIGRNQHRFGHNQGLSLGLTSSNGNIGYQSSHPQYYQSGSHSINLPSITHTSTHYDDGHRAHDEHSIHGSNRGFIRSHKHQSVHKSGPIVHKTVEYKTHLPISHGLDHKEHKIFTSKHSEYQADKKY